MNRRPLEALGSLVAIAWLCVLVWERLDPDGPQEAWDRAVQAWAEYRGYREAMERTLDEIRSIPEAER